MHRCGQRARAASAHYAPLTVRRRAATRMPTPTRFITTIVAVILNANVATLATWMIGNTESTIYNTVIASPDADATRNQSAGRGVTPRRPNSGIANITT